MMPTADLFRSLPELEMYVEGETIFRAGQAGHVMYIVHEGEVDILINGRWIETVGEGGVFGEMGLVDSQPRAFSAVARMDARVLPINPEQFHEAVREEPSFALQVMSVMADRLRYMHELYELPS